MKTIRYYASVAAILTRQSIQSRLEYPFMLAGHVLANCIQWVVGFATIKFVVDQFGSIGGWGYESLAFLYGMSVLSHGLAVVFFIQTWGLGYWVIAGEFDQFLLYQSAACSKSDQYPSDSLHPGGRNADSRRGVAVLRLHVLLDQEYGQFHGYGGGAVRAGVHVPPDHLPRVGPGTVYLFPASGVDHLLARQGYFGTGTRHPSCASGGHYPGGGAADVCRELRGLPGRDGEVRKRGELSGRNCVKTDGGASVS